jgi:hypothetical protein
MGKTGSSLSPNNRIVSPIGIPNQLYTYQNNPLHSTKVINPIIKQVTT